MPAKTPDCSPGFLDSRARTSRGGVARGHRPGRARAPNPRAPRRPRPRSPRRVTPRPPSPRTSTRAERIGEFSGNRRPHLRRAPDRLRGGSDPSADAYRHTEGGRSLSRAPTIRPTHWVRARNGLASSAQRAECGPQIGHLLPVSLSWSCRMASARTSLGEVRTRRRSRRAAGPSAPARRAASSLNTGRERISGVPMFVIVA
jgi:hypothetical protein